MKNWNIIKELQTLLPAKEFIIAGSQAISMHGIPCGVNPGDIDILIHQPTTYALGVLNRLQSENPNPKFLNTTQGNGAVDYSFIYKDVQVDIWLLEPQTLDAVYLQYDGVSINPISDIVEAKKRQNRAKDFVQRMQWAQQIFSLSEDPSTVRMADSYEKKRNEEVPVKYVDPLGGFVTDDDDLPF